MMEGGANAYGEGECQSFRKAYSGVDSSRFWQMTALKKIYFSKWITCSAFNLLIYV
jgi:hypothetical protein